MPPERVERKLAAILAADVAGYSRLMGADEEGTIAQLKSLRRELIDPKIKEHGGRIVRTVGDGILVEFASVVDAVRCAVELQREIIQRNTDVPSERRIEFRIGINLGDIVIDEGDVVGDGVNVAARLESLAEPGKIYVSRVVRDQVRDKLGLVFDDLGERQVKNIARPVHVYRISERGSTQPTVKPSPSLEPTLALPDKPSIAVLPFQNISGDPEQEYFADGMVEAIITALSRIRWLFVIARNSSFTYKGQAVDVKRVARELGVRYVLEGSVYKVANRVRIAGQLIDAASGAHLWADHFDGLLDDIFDLQDKVSVSVAGVIEPALQDAELRRSVQRPTTDLTAYDLYLRARAELRPWDKEGNHRALHLFGRALERDPDYGLALGHAAICHAQLHATGWTNDLEASRREGLDLARRALRVAGDDPTVLADAADALGYFGEDIAAALTLVDRALELNPSYALGWLRSGWLRLWAGQSNLAIPHFETSIRLSPRESRAPAYLGIGIAHFFLMRFEEALALLLRSLQERPGWVPTLRFLASCYAQMGRLNEAREIVERLRKMTRVVVPSATHWRDPQQRELYLEGLRLAAGEMK